MKFLMFNVVVIGALAYLVVGPGGIEFFREDAAVPAPVAAKSPVPAPKASEEEIAAKAKELYETVYAKRMKEVETFFSMVDAEINENENEITAGVAPKPKPALEKKAPVLPAAKEVDVVAVHKPPPPANPVGNGKPMVTAQADAGPAFQKAEPEPAPKFMTPRQRARELNRLARDMQIFSTGKLTD